MMAKKVVVFLADGFEEIEALTQVDILRRAGAEVVTVGVTGQTVQGAHGVPVIADVPAEGFTLPLDTQMVVLPGGGPGTENLKKSETVKQALAEAAEKGLVMGAICAAPSVLFQQGLLEGKRYTAFPGVLENASGQAVEVDGNIITARSAGVALQFAHALVAALLGPEVADQTIQSVYP